MLYYYKALNSKGDEVTDYIDAPNETAAKQKIKNETSMELSKAFIGLKIDAIKLVNVVQTES